MRILLVLDRVENPASANALMGFRLAEQLLRRDHTVHILTLWDGLHPPPAPPEGAMQHLLAFADEQAQIEAAKAAVARELTVRQLEKLAKAAKAADKPVKEKPVVRRDTLYDEVELSLREELGRQVRVTVGPKGGTLQVEFFDLDDLKSLARRLGEL